MYSKEQLEEMGITKIDQVLTISQAAKEMGVTDTYVATMAKQLATTGHTKLDLCYPFPKIPGTLTGPRFVIRNDKYEYELALRAK